MHSPSPQRRTEVFCAASCMSPLPPVPQFPHRWDGVDMTTQAGRLNTWLCTADLQTDFSWKGPLEASDPNPALSRFSPKFKPNLTVTSGGSMLPQLNFEFLCGNTGDKKLSTPHP